MKTRIALVMVMLSGAAQAAGPTVRPLVQIDDFDDGDLEAAPGLSWMAIGDWLVGGPSAASVSILRLPTGGALRIEGHLEPGKTPGRSYAGAWTALRGDGGDVDLTGYRGLRFRARGTPGTYVAGIRRVAGGSSANLVAPFTADADWATIELPFSDLAQVPTPPQGQPMAFVPDGLRWMGFASGPNTPADFKLDIDDVQLVPVADDAPASWAARKVTLAEPRALAGLAWTSIGKDGRGDGVSPRLPDAREVQVASDGDRVWFRVLLHDAPPEKYFGLNVALDVDGDPANGMAWWGQNKGFHFDRLLTAYLAQGAGYWQGMAGVADAASIGAGRFDAASTDVQVVVDRAGRALAIGVPRAALGLAPGGKVRLIATVGSNMSYSDDVPADGALDAVIAVQEGPVTR